MTKTNGVCRSLANCGIRTTALAFLRPGEILCFPLINIDLQGDICKSQESNVVCS